MSKSGDNTHDGQASGHLAKRTSYQLVDKLAQASDSEQKGTKALLDGAPKTEQDFRELLQQIWEANPTIPEGVRLVLEGEMYVSKGKEGWCFKEG